MSLPDNTGLVPLGSLSGGSVQSLDKTLGNYFTATIVGNTTLNVSNLPPGQSMFVMVTRTAAAAVVTWAGQAAAIGVTFPPLSTVLLHLIGSTDSPYSACVVAGLYQPSTALAGDEVMITSNGTDDTATLCAILAASLVARVVPPGSALLIDGTNSATLLTGSATAGDVGGIIGDGEHGAIMKPIAGWAPAAGLVDDPTNSFLRVNGGAVSGGWTTTTPNILERGSSVIDGIVSTAGMLAGQYVRLLADAPSAGLQRYGEIAKIQSVDSATQITLTSPIRLMYGDSYTSLPVTLTQWQPITRFFIKNLTWNTLDRNIASGVFLSETFPAAAGSLSPATAQQAIRQLYSERNRYMGMRRGMFSVSCVQGFQFRDDYSAGSNNGYINGCDLAGNHNNSITGFRATPSGPPYAANGSVRTSIWLEAGGSDNWIDDCDFSRTSGGIHIVGGFANKLGFYRGFFGNAPDIRWTRDPALSGGGKQILGALLDQYIVAGKSEHSYGYDFGNGYCSETYTNGTAKPVTAGLGVHSFLFCDSDGIYANVLDTTNIGNGTDTLGGVPYHPCGGVAFWDCFRGGRINAINCRCAVPLSTTVGGWSGGGSIGSISFDKKPGKSTGTPVTACMQLDSTGSGCTPDIENIIMVDGGNLVEFGASYVNDYAWRIGHMKRLDAGTEYYGIQLAINAGPVTYQETEVCALDPAAPAGTRQVIAAGPDAKAPVIVAMVTNTARVLLALEGGSALVAGTVTLQDCLTTEGGATHRAKVNNAALAGATDTILGYAKTAKGAGNAVMQVRRP